jgi:uncharacterized membrane protein
MDDEKQRRKQERPEWQRMTWPWSASWNQLTGCCAGPVALYGVAIVIIGVVVYFFISQLTH